MTSLFLKSSPYINRCESKLGIYGWLNFFPSHNLVISSFRSNCKSVYIVGFFFFHFPLLIIRSRHGCVWFTSGGSGRGRVLPAPLRNALRGVEGGAAVGVIYFVNIFGPQGPHSRPPWLVSRPRLSARESIISSGYGPFKVFPQLSLSFSCGSGEATPSCLAMRPPWPAGPLRASQGRGPTGTVPCAPTAAMRPAPPCLSSPRAALRLSHHPDFLSPQVFLRPLTNKIPGPVLEARILLRAPAPGSGGDLQGVTPAFCISLLLKLPKEIWYLIKVSWNN